MLKFIRFIDSYLHYAGLINVGTFVHALIAKWEMERGFFIYIAVATPKTHVPVFTVANPLYLSRDWAHPEVVMAYVTTPFTYSKALRRGGSAKPWSYVNCMQCVTRVW